MDEAAVAARIEHTVLGPMTTTADVTGTLDAALKERMRACVPPCFVSMASEYAPDVSISTVVGFPHGQHTTETKSTEAVTLVEQGADELDVVANLGYLQAGDDEAFRQDIEEVVAATTVPVTVIVEAPLLDDGEKRRAAELAAEADADYLKTATGFSEGSATTEDVELLATHLPLKASGGIDTWGKASAMLDAGAERIGTSSGVVLLEGYRRAKE
jgi:deoxyribose-phosphate aldolase